MLLDTSGLLALLDADSRQHREAAEHYRPAAKRLTHSYILSEFITLAMARGFPVREAVRFVEDLLQDPAIRVVWVNEHQHRRAHALLIRRLDKTYSLCDAVSFGLMREAGLREALTTDRHFEQEGFARLLKP